jgi:isocitrate dehydrogenase
MLVHIGQSDVAELVHNAWLRTLEDGIHTYDIFVEGVSKQKVGTKEFAQAVIARIGQRPEKLKAVSYAPSEQQEAVARKPRMHSHEKKELVGVDVYLEWDQGTPDQLGDTFKKVCHNGLELKAITNRGARVWPHGMPETFTTDHWRGRFMSSQAGKPVTHAQVVDLLQHVAEAGFDFIKTENLYTFDGNAEYSTIPGE